MQHKSNQNIWKEKSKMATKKSKAKDKAIKRLKKSRDQWKEKFKEAKSSSKLEKVKGQHFPLVLIWLGLIMRIKLNISLNGVSKSLCCVAKILGLKVDSISPSTIRNWCMRYGYYKLQEELPEGRYAAIFDESVEMGQEKLLLILAVRLDERDYLKPLTMADAKVISMGVRKSWTRDAIVEAIQARMNKEGVHFEYVISDNGQVLGNAYKACGLTKIEDFGHEMANILKKLYGKEAGFNDFIKKMNATRAKWILSSHAALTPPGLRAKSRFHQLFAVSEWATRILCFWVKLSGSEREELEYVKKEEKLVEEMALAHKLIGLLSKVLKSQGISESSEEECERILKRAEETRPQSRVIDFIESVRQYIKRQREKLPSVTNILCSSDIIES